MRRHINSRITLKCNIGFNRLLHSPLLRLWKRTTSRQAKGKLHAVFCRYRSCQTISSGQYAWEWHTLGANMSLMSAPNLACHEVIRWFGSG